MQVRRSNRTNQRIKTYLKELSALAEDIKSGNKPVSAWDKEAREMKKQYDKDLIEIGKSIDESQKLRIFESIAIVCESEIVLLNSRA